MNKKVIIVESNKELIGRIKYYLNEYFNHTIDLLICEDLQECIKQIHSYDVVFINDLLDASSLVLYIDSHKLKVEVIVTSNNPENYDIYKGVVSSFILSPYGYKEIVNAFNKAFNRFNENTSLLFDSMKCFLDFEKHPEANYDMNVVKEKLKQSLKEKFDIDYVGLDILDRNNEYYLCKNDHDKWQEACKEWILPSKTFADFFSAKKFLRMKSLKSNYYFNINKSIRYDFRAQVIGERKNGICIFIYDERGDVKIALTITFKESNINMDKLDKRIVEAITEEIRNSEYLKSVKLFFFGKIASYKRQIALNHNLSISHTRQSLLDYQHDMLWSIHDKTKKSRKIEY